jgi:glycosyltransferase involved in cell wall biosynthesis
MTKKRIILIRNAKSYDFGGGERFPVFIAEILTSSDWQPLIISRSPKLLAFAKSKDIKTIRGWWWSWQNWSGPFALLFPVYVLWQIILFLWYFLVFLVMNPRTIHIQSKDDFIAATFAGRLLGKRVVWTDHADLKHIWQNLDVWYKNPVGKFVRLAASLANTITVVSKSERSLVTANLRPHSTLRQRITVVYNGAEDVAQQYTAQNGNSEETIFCVASRLVKDKGIGEVITAFGELSKSHPKSRLVIMGDGPDAELFKTQANQYKNIDLLGHQTDPLAIIATSDIFVHPTYHEGFSVALVEASMLSKPIIATNVGGNTEIITDHKTGLLVPAKNAQKLFEAMELAYQDKDLREKLGRHARTQYEERFNFEHIVTDEFIPLYEGKKR